MQNRLLNKLLLIIILCFTLIGCNSIKKDNKNLYTKYLIANYTNNFSFISKYSKDINHLIYKSKVKACAARMNFICQQFLARSYLESDIKESIFWYKVSLYNGNYFASYILGDIYSDDDFVSKNIELSNQYLEIAAMNGIAITSYVKLLKSHYNDEKGNIIIWENVLYRLHKTDGLDNIERLLFKKYIAEFNVSYIELHNELKLKEDLLFNNILKMIKINKENTKKEISKIRI